MKDLDRKFTKLESKLEASIGGSITRSETNIMEAVGIVLNRKLRIIYIGWGIILIGLVIIGFLI